MSEPEVLHEWSLNESYRLRIEGNDDGVTKTRLRFRYKDGPWQPDPGAQYVLMDEIARLAATVKALREERKRAINALDNIALLSRRAQFYRGSRGGLEDWKHAERIAAEGGARPSSPLRDASVPTVSAEEE